MIALNGAESIYEEEDGEPQLELCAAPVVEGMHHRSEGWESKMGGDKECMGRWGKREEECIGLALIGHHTATLLY